jgi:hypothetical protein
MIPIGKRRSHSTNINILSVIPNPALLRNTRDPIGHRDPHRKFRPGGELWLRAWRTDLAPEGTMMEAELENGRRALDWIRIGSNSLGRPIFSTPMTNSAGKTSGPSRWRPHQRSFNPIYSFWCSKLMKVALINLAAAALTRQRPRSWGDYRGGASCVNARARWTSSR